MKLKKIDITYFRCFESISIPLQPDVNVFVGGNGAGKTAILDAIAVILWDVVAASGGGGKRERNAQNATLRPSDVTVSLDQSAGRPAGASQTRDFVHIKAWADQFQGVGDDRAESAKPDLEWQNLIRFIPPAKFYYENRQSDHLSKIYGYLENLWDANGLAGSKNPVGIPVVAYYRANRKLNATPTVSGTVAMSLERREAFKNALNAGVDYDAMCHWFYQRETHEIHKKLQYGHGMGIKLSELDSVRSAIGKVIDDVDRIAFEGTPPKLKITLRDKQKENASTLELDQLSDGYKNLLALVMDFARRLAQANPDCANPLEAPGILLVDEVERHLHTSWQQQVIPKLREAFPNTQLIVTTHSPQVLTTINRKNVFILKDKKLYSANKFVPPQK